MSPDNLDLSIPKFHHTFQQNINVVFNFASFNQVGSSRYVVIAEPDDGILDRLSNDRTGTCKIKNIFSLTGQKKSFDFSTTGKGIVDIKFDKAIASGRKIS